MDTFKNLISLFGAAALVWLSAAVVGVVSSNTEIQNAALILAFLTTLIFGLVAGLTAIDNQDKATAEASRGKHEKAKRDAAAAQDARLALLLSLLSEDERESLKSRLIDDLSADGEAVSLAELLAAQDEARGVRRA